MANFEIKAQFNQNCSQVNTYTKVKSFAIMLITGQMRGRRECNDQNVGTTKLDLVHRGRIRYSNHGKLIPNYNPTT